MKVWPLNNLYFVVFLAIGFFATLPFVLGLAGDWWWIALPAIAAWTVVLWVWGLPFIADTPEEARSWSLPEKIGGTLIMLGQSVVGAVMAVFLVGFLIHEWVATVLAILIMAVVIFWFGRDPPKPKPSAPAHEQSAKPEPAHPVSAAVLPHQPPATLQDWLLHHVSLILFVGFGGLTVSDCIYRHSFALGWPAVAMTLSYAAFIWIHVVSPPKPGEPPPTLWYKALATFMTVVMTIVFLMVLVVIVEAIGRFWIWVVPPVGILALVVALNWRSGTPRGVATAEARHGGRSSARHRIVS